MEEVWSWRRGSVIASSLILLLVCFAVSTLIWDKVDGAVAAQPSNLVPLPFLLFVAYEVVVILCHLARILAAKLVGFELLVFTCGPFAIRMVRGHKKFSWTNRETMLTGATIFAPKNLEGLRWRCILLNASAPVSIIVIGAIFLTIVRSADPVHASIETLFFAAMAFTGIVAGVRLLLPFARDRSNDFGTLVWDGIRGRPTAEAFFLINAIKCEGQQGIGPRDWPSAWVDRLAVLTERIDFPERFIVCFLCFYRAIDLRDIASASRFLDEAVARVNPKSRMFYTRIMLEKAFFEAWFKRNEFAARKAFDRVQDWSVVARHIWLRASAAVAAVEGRYEECHRQAQEALEIVQSLPVVHRLAVEWLEELLDSHQVQC
jgi:hypothetical protein